MTLRPTVLLVAPTPTVATTFYTWLTDAGYDLTVVGSFAAAKRHLELVPSVLIAEVRLGEYNGLHLALRAQAQDIPAIVLGEPDPVLQREAQQLGAVYLTPDVAREQLLSVVAPMAASSWTHASPTMPTDVSFISWSECRPPIHSVREFVRTGGRRILPS